MTVLLEIAAKACLVLGGAALLALSLRKGAAATRHLVWSIAVLTVLALHVLVGVTPKRAIPVRVDPAVVALLGGAADDAGDRARSAEQASVDGGDGPAAATIPTTIPSDGIRSAGDSVDAGEGFSAGQSVNAVQSVNGGEGFNAGQAEHAVNPVTLGGVTPRPARSPAALLLTLWLAGAVLVLSLLVAERVRLARLARRARSCNDPRLRDRFAQHAAAARSPSRATLRIGDYRTMPMTWGVWRPVVMLPADVATWSRARIDAVLRHELAHVRRRDDLVQLAAGIVAAMHWFNPLAWLAMHRLRVEREYACDDEVLGCGAAPSAYAAELLAIARGFHMSAVTGLTASSMAPRSGLRCRLLAVLEEHRRRTALTRRHVATGGALALLLAVPLASAALALAPTPTRALPQARSTISECWSPGVDRNATNLHDTDDRFHTYLWDSDNCHGEISLHGDLRFNDDFTEIVGVSADGSFRLDHEERGTRRRLDITPTGNGGIAVAWSVDGQQRDFDAAAAGWIADLLPQLLRSTGIAAEERTASIYRRQGAAGVFNEVSLMDSNSGRSRYLVALVAQPGLQDDDLVRVAEIARDDIDSNSNRSRVLKAFGEQHRAKILDGRVATAFWQSLYSIESNSTTARLLGDLVEGEPEGSALLTRVIEAAAERIDSNSTRASFLRRLKSSYPDIATAGPHRDQFWETLALTDSNSTIRTFLLDISEGEPLDSELLAKVLATAREKLNSNGTRAEFLSSLERRYPGISRSGPLADDFWAVVESINSSSTLHRLLLELAAGEPDDSASLDRILDAARSGLRSSSQKGRFLVAFAEQHPGPASGRLQASLLEAAREIESRSTRERTLETLGGMGIGRLP